MTSETSAPTWTIDPIHSSVEFSLAYMGMSVYRTRFRSLEGTLTFDPEAPARSSVTASIPVASIDVTNERLMGRLMDPDLLGGRDYPTMTFRSTAVEPVDATRWTVKGELTIHGVTRPVALHTRVLGQSKSPFTGKIVAAFRAEMTIDRHDFGVSWNTALETGGTYLGEQVDVSLVIMGVRQD
ncbi:MAG: YceI family protein [Candidatus Rokubacteria bacterium]|nr:YceI family protein [Candidatus Rokubacteria bacterium]